MSLSSMPLPVAFGFPQTGHVMCCTDVAPSAEMPISLGLACMALLPQLPMPTIARSVQTVTAGASVAAA